MFIAYGRETQHIESSSSLHAESRHALRAYDGLIVFLVRVVVRHARHTPYRAKELLRVTGIVPCLQKHLNTNTV